MKPEYVRGFRDTDAEAVEALLLAAFGGPGEAGLVRALRASSALAVELVLPWEGRIIAHVGLSRRLAPLAVAEAWRGRRLGVRMAKAAVSLAVGRTVVVLGEPAFYARAGFSVARAAGLVSPYGSSQTLIARPGDDMPEGELIYPAAFAGA